MDVTAKSMPFYWWYLNVFNNNKHIIRIYWNIDWLVENLGARAAIYAYNKWVNFYSHFLMLGIATEDIQPFQYNYAWKLLDQYSRAGCIIYMYTSIPVMHVCMYVCMYVCIYVCMYECMYACVYICMYVCTYVCMYVCVNIHMYVFLSVSVCMYVCK